MSHFKSDFKHNNANTKTMRLVMSSARFLLSNTLGFRDCQPSTLDALVNSASLRTLSKGEELTCIGDDPFKALILVVKGTLESSLVHSNGRRYLLGFSLPGEVLGLTSLIDGFGAVSDIRGCAGGATVVLIPENSIIRLRKLDDQLGLAFESQLAYRSRLDSERLTMTPSLSLNKRVAKTILMLADQFGIECSDGVRLALKISQADLADWLGVSRSKINLAVQVLKAQKLITISYSRITLVDKLRLTQFSRL